MKTKFLLVLTTFILSATITKAQNDFVTLWDMSLGTGSHTQIKFYTSSKRLGVGLGDWQTVPFSSGGSFNTFGNGLCTITVPANATIKLTLYGSEINFFRMQDTIAGASFVSPSSSQLIDVQSWGSSTNCVSMANMFSHCYNLNIFSATDFPNLNSVLSMFGMFDSCVNLTSVPGIETWNTANVVNMSSTFNNCSNFNSDISLWNTGKVQLFNGMFNNAILFNQPINNWDTKNAIKMSNVFTNATNFNQDISSWDVTKVNLFNGMFDGASNFNQDLSAWAAKFVSTNTVLLQNFLSSSGMSVANYDAFLLACYNNAPNTILLSSNNLKYCTSAAVRNLLITPVISGGKGWTIIGDAPIVPFPVVVSHGATHTGFQYCTYVMNAPGYNTGATERKILDYNKNGNTFNLTNFNIYNRTNDNLTAPVNPNTVSSATYYYQVKNATNTMRISHKRQFVKATGVAAANSFATNGGVIVRLYYDATDTATVLSVAFPVGTLTTKGWYFFTTTASNTTTTAGADVVRAMTPVSPFLNNATDIVPVAWGTESGVKYAEFKITKSGIIGYYAKTTAGVLPITLESFTANKAINYNTLKWTTSAEINLSHYEIESSTNSINYSKLASINAMGASTYSYNDNTKYNSNTYYRLKIVNNDGSISYSPIVVIKANQSAAVSVYPNPVKDKASLQLSNSSMLNSTATLLNAVGMVVKVIYIKTNIQEIDMSNLSSGMYLLKLANGEIMKIMKQ